MAFHRLNNASQLKGIPADENQQILVPVNSDFYGLHIKLNGLDATSGAGTSLKRIYSTDADTALALDIADSSVTTDNTDEDIHYKNEIPEKAYFLLIDYTKGTNAAASSTIDIYRGSE